MRSTFRELWKALTRMAWGLCLTKFANKKLRTNTVIVFILELVAKISTTIHTAVFTGRFYCTVFSVAIVTLPDV